MATPRIVRLTGAALLGAILAARAAYGQQVVPVTLEGDGPGVSLDLAGIEQPRQRVACGERCSLDLAPGRYAVTVTATDGHRSSTTLSIKRPSHITFTPPSRTGYTAGVVLLGAGVAAGVLGGLVFLYGAQRRLAESYSCDGDCTDRTPAWVLSAGLIGMGSGFVLAGAGAVVYTVNSEPDANVRRLPRRAGDHARLWLNPVVGEDRAGLVLVGRF